jgi:hypothetical protein
MIEAYHEIGVPEILPEHTRNRVMSVGLEWKLLVAIAGD